MTTAMTHGPTVLREVDPAERYYWLLDQLAPMNIAAIAELDRRLDPSEVAAALAAVQRQHPFLRARIEVVDDQLSVVEAAGEIALTVTGVGGSGSASGSGSGWLAEVEAELDRPFAPAPSPLVRCLYCPVEGIHGEERSVLVVVVHHALADGRAAVAALQHVLRLLSVLPVLQRIEEGGEPMSSPADVPPALHHRFPSAFRSAKGALGVLGVIREERDGQDDAASFPFHGREVKGQASRLDRLIVQPEMVRTLRDQARSAGATINGVLAAAVLESTAALFEPSGDRMLNLATPTDLRRRVEPPLPADGVFMAIGLLCTPYLVSSTDSGSGTGTGTGNPELARRITEQTRREVERGESHLFYRFARAGSFAATEDGITSFADWMAATAHNVAVSNLGVVDDQGDPAWVQSISFALSTSANQPAFVAVCTYRDQLVLNLATDRTKLPADFASRLVEGIGQRIGAAAGG